MVWLPCRGQTRARSRERRARGGKWFVVVDEPAYPHILSNSAVCGVEYAAVSCSVEHAAERRTAQNSHILTVMAPPPGA